MPSNPPMLHMFCGKIAAGKSTLAAGLARAPGSILIAEDAWLSALFASEMETPRDYVRCAAKLRTAMGPHVADLLLAGVDVVLDFPANTREMRGWMRGILDRTGANHRLHVLSPPDAVCLERLRLRNATGDHPFAASEADFHLISEHFEPPGADEGFTLVVHDA